MYAFFTVLRAIHLSITNQYCYLRIVIIIIILFFHNNVAYARLIYPISILTLPIYWYTLIVRRCRNIELFDVFYVVAVVSHPERIAHFSLLFCSSISVCTQHPNVHYSIIHSWNLIHSHTNTWQERRFERLSIACRIQFMQFVHDAISRCLFLPYKLYLIHVCSSCAFRSSPALSTIHSRGFALPLMPHADRMRARSCEMKQKIASNKVDSIRSTVLSAFYTINIIDMPLHIQYN